MPSNVRVYFHSPLTFGVDTAQAFSLFGIESFEAAERFLTNLARSSLAALTLCARTLRHDSSRGTYTGLDYQDVWLDKDAVVAADGTLHFADLEGIEDISMRDAAAVREAVERQFRRHVYEASYAWEALAVEVERRFRVFREPFERRRWILEILERAAIGDPFLSIERRQRALALVVEPATDPAACTVEIELATEADA